MSAHECSLVTISRLTNQLESTELGVSNFPDKKQEKNITGTRKTKDKFPIEQFLHGDKLLDKNEIIKVANSFNEDYVDVGSKLVGVVPPVADGGDQQLDSTFRWNQLLKLIL